MGTERDPRVQGVMDRGYTEEQATAFVFPERSKIEEYAIKYGPARDGKVIGRAEPESAAYWRGFEEGAQAAVTEAEKESTPCPGCGFHNCLAVDR